MKKSDKQKIIESYNEGLEKYGYDRRSLQWFKGRQLLRYEVLAEIGDLNNSSVLDVGCGFGDFYGLLTRNGLNVKFMGYDINPNLVNIARKVHPTAHFEVKDTENEEISEKFDWVFESGIFNNKISDNKAWVQNMLRKMFELSKKGVAANFMSTYVDFKNECIYYAKPEEIFGFCKTLSKRVTLRHDYMPFEFCVYVYKDDRVNERNVFAEFERG